MTRLRLFFPVVALAFAVCTSAATSNQGAADSGEIVGTVADDRGTAIAGAMLTLTSTNPPVFRTAVTDAGGRFQFARLNPGDYALLAVPPPGYAPREFGQTKADGPAAPVRVGRSARTDAAITVPRTGSISGVLVDDSGAPTAGAVRATTWIQRSGQRTRPVFSAESDDTGRYQIDNLGPGEYIVSAGAISGNDIRRMTPMVIAQAERAVAHPDEPVPANVNVLAPTFQFVNIFYPDVATQAASTPVIVTAGQDHDGIDLRLHTSPTAQVDGEIYDPLGAPVANALVAVFDRSGARIAQYSGYISPADKDGRFHAGALPPGRYRFEVSHTVQLGRPGEARRVARTWGMADVDAVAGTTALARIDLAEGARVSGAITFHNVATTAPDFARARVSLLLMDGPYRGLLTAGTLQANVDRAGRFVIEGVPPGTYLVQATTASDPPWVAASVTVLDHDALDTPFTVDVGSDIAGASVVLTDRATDLTGTAADSTGQPARAGWIAVFPDDPKLWTRGSRRIAALRIDQIGTFKIRGLPAGGYLAAFAPNPIPDAPIDPKLLAPLRANAARFTLDEYGTATVHVVVK